MSKAKQRLKKTKIVLRVLGIGWRARPGAVIGFFAGALLETVAFLVSIFASAQLAGLLAQYISGKSTNGIWFWLWTDVAAAAVMGVSFWIMTWTKRLLYFRTTTLITYQFQAALCRLDIQDFFDDKTRNQINKVQNGYVWQISGLNEATLDLFYGIIRFGATAAVVAQIAWWLIPVIGVFLLPTLLLNNRLAKMQWFVWDAKGDERHIFWGLDYLIRQVKNQMELRSSQARGYVLQRIHDMNLRFYDRQEHEFSKPNNWLGVAKIIEVGGTAAGSILALRQFLAGVITLEKYFFVSGAVLRIGGAMNNIFGTLNRMQEPILLTQDYFALIDRQPQFVDIPEAVPLDNVGAPEIVFDHVDFTYPGQTKPVFKDLSFTIKPGEHVAIVGENGAGKSTLIKLLLRFYRPTSGRILIDGKDLQKLEIETWYHQLASLFQEFNRYPMPIKENIEIARPQYAGDQKRLVAASKFSNVDSFVKEYQHGWETVLDNSFEKGVEPSGGQWQRVALARAFYRDANVLILDEPTAAIDAKAEYDIFNNIFSHYQNKTAIIVSHRFSTVRRAHTIIVIDRGKIVERGSHEELMKRPDGLYHELFTKQAEGYRE